MSVENGPRADVESFEHGPLGHALRRWLGAGEEASITVVADSELEDAADLVVVPIGQRRPAPSGGVAKAGAEAAAPFAEDRRYDEGLLAARGFDAAPGSSLLLLPAAAGATELLVGVGPADSVGREELRRAGAAAARQLAAERLVAADLRALPERGGPGGARAAGLVQAFVEGFLLASYRYEALRSAGAAAGSPGGDAASARGRRLERLVVVSDESGAAERGVERGLVVVAAARLARDLVNTPAADCTPAAIAALAAELGRREGFAVQITDAAAAAEQGLGGLLGVARGSAEPPLLVRLDYEPEVEAPPSGRRRVALVGKGITFDSGGLSLKTADGMMTMKTDMSGAAAVLAAVAACRRLGVDKRVVGFMPLTENMPGGRAMKPGDVLRMRNGRSVEVLNTDAEGRLVLADALSLAAEERPDAVVDLATLTGACVVALGRRVAGLMGTDEALVGAVSAAAEAAGEAVWHLPLPEQYRKLLDSEVADMKNVGPSGQAGTLVAGLFLREFTGGRPWAHLDIAGPARSEEDEGYLRKGATGFGVRLLLELLESSSLAAAPSGG